MRTSSILLFSALFAAATSGALSAASEPGPRAPRSHTAERAGQTADTWANEAEGFAAQGVSGRAGSQAPKVSQARPAPAVPQQEHYYFEAAFAVFLVLCVINVLIGRRSNEKIAQSWVQEFAGPGSILESNFSLLGSGDHGSARMLMKQSQNNFQFYASGRRYCSGLLATLNLRPRQDLLSMGFILFEPRDDRVEIEVTMNEGSMGPFCLAAGLAKVTRTLLKDQRDLAMYAKAIDVDSGRIKDWPQSLAVVTESSGVFYDLFCDGIVEHAFSPQVYRTLTGKYFRYLHFTSEYEGLGRKVLRFSFKLPPRDKMSDLTRLIDMVMKFVDLVGSYQMSPKVREKAEKVRAEERKKVEKGERKTMDEEVQKKKQERREAEHTKLSAMNPVARAKYKEKQEAILMKRAMKKRTIK